jgi:hypothetical protein
MADSTKRLLYWAPRVLCIAFAAFTSIFAIDVFSMPLEPAEMVVALFLHLIPTALIVFALWVSWRHEWFGAAFFPLLAVLHFATKSHLDPLAYVIVDGPLFVLGVLFWLNWVERAALRPGTT